MTDRPSPYVEWIWRLEHPSWHPDADWQPVVTCVCVDSGSERCLIDPLLPPEEAKQVWNRLAEGPPTAVAVLSPDHMRRTWSHRNTNSVDAVVRRYGCRAFGPGAFDPNEDLPKPMCKRSFRKASFQVACSRLGIHGAGTRRLFGFHNSGPWFSPTHSPSEPEC